MHKIRSATSEIRRKSEVVVLFFSTNMRRRGKSNFSPHIRIVAFLVGSLCLFGGHVVPIPESPQKEGSKALLVLLPFYSPSFRLLPWYMVIPRILRRCLDGLIIYFTLPSNDNIDVIRSLRYSATRLIIACGEPVTA